MRQKIALLPALAANVLNMVGIGPFITVPLVIGAMGGPQAMLGWALGALIALCDGLVWAEFGAALPDSGGSYRYLREAYGPKSWGRLMSFLFLAQTVVSAPLTAASGGVGLAQYAEYLFPGMSYWHTKTIAIAVCLVATWLLYRNIQAVGRIALVMTGVLLATMAWIIGAGAMHFQARLALDFPPHAFQVSGQFLMGLGAATLIAMYDYSGYFNVCLIGGEVERPERNIPRCIVLSIVMLGFAYAAMNLAMIGVVPWREAMQSQTIVSDFAARVAGGGAARVMTVLILVAAFGSVYSVLLGYSRVPYAAALDGQFFRVFGRVHRDGFPSFSVLAMGLVSAAACLLPLDALIKTLLVIQIMTQFAAQCVGLLILRRYRLDIVRPFSMPLYPVPVFVALGGWALILISSGLVYLTVGAASVGAGVLAFLVFRRKPQRAHAEVSHS